MYAFEEVKQNYTTEMKEWHKRFQKAARIKRLAYLTWGWCYDPIISARIDKRMEFVWSKVAEVEPFPTFINGELTDKAAYYLNGITILQVTKQII